MNDRHAFDDAIRSYTAGDKNRARAMFEQITTTNPAMSDAWLGRIACGDHNLTTLAGAHTNSRLLGKETARWPHLPPRYLSAHVTGTFYVNLLVWNRPTIALAYAAALIAAERYDDALAVLNEPVIVEEPAAAQWRQFLTALLFHKTCRWNDERAATAVNPPHGATHIESVLTAAVDTLAAWSAAYLGHTDEAVKIAAKVLSAIDATAYPAIVADAHMIRGWCLRELDDDTAATAEFQLAVGADGQLIHDARLALENPLGKMVITTAETIATRTDKWDHTTQTCPKTRAAGELAEQRAAALRRAQTMLDSLIGLERQKQDARVWRTEKQIDMLCDGAGNQENHMVLEGPPGVGKTTLARIFTEQLFGLGITDRPELTEVTEEDIVVGYVSQTAQKMKEVCENALGGVLFIDEAPRLVPTTEGHSFGRDAIRTLLKYMEDYRDKLVVIVAGYADEMPRFLDADSGLRSRFSYTMTFDSYSPEEIVQIGQRIAKAERVAVAEDAWPLLNYEAERLRAMPSDHGTALDVAGNARFARKVVRCCKRERARRLCELTPDELEALAAEPASLTVTADDMTRALASATTGL